ncbi:MAG: alpha/beta hydrolase family protein [Dehalococcoidia bacterium]
MTDLRTLLRNPIAAWRALAILLDLAFGGLGIPFQLLRRDIVIEEVAFSGSGGRVVADLYRPKARSRRPAVVLGHGMVSTGKEDPRLRRAATIFARAGYMVLVPEMRRLKQQQVDAEDAQVLVDSVDYLCPQPFVKPSSIALAGFCVSASLALVAAEDPRINQKVSLVSSWGGYFDIHSLVNAVATHFYEYQGRRFPWRPAPNVKPIVADTLVRMVPSLGEQEYLKSVLKGRGNGGSGEGNAPPSQLSALGGSVLRFIDSDDPADVDEIWDLLAPEAHQRLASVSPATHIEKLRAQAFVIHGEGDGTVPSIESRRLADAISDQRQVHYSTFSFFDHVNPEVSRITLANLPNLAGDVIKFYRYLYGILCRL